MTSNTLFTLSRLGYFALVLLLGGWFVGQGISGEYTLLFSLLWIVPLLLPAKGVFQGNPYTYAWASFILCLYMLHGLTLLYVTTDAFALIEVLLIGVLLIAFPFYARIRGRELGLGLKKKSKE
ncbi:DUF2069 domain-containing protein [Shewanella putrefaciens]|nr:DUF2069 domain-containing protein [Shewanella putrefaciens]